MKSINLGDRIGVMADAEIFVVPNKAVRVSDYKRDDRQRNRLRSLGEKMSEEELSLDSFNDNTPFVEVWMLSKDLECDNMQDHAFSFTVDGQKYIVPSGQIPSRVPINVIDVKENESFTLHFRDLEAYPARSNGDSVNVYLSLDVTARQSEYRYARFGRFEQVLDYVS